MPVGGMIGASVIGAGASIFGATKAADAQKNAAAQANALAAQQMQVNQQNFAPWITGGQNAYNTVQMLTGTNPGGNPLTSPLTSPFAPTIQQLEQTPGYKFVLDQGLKSVQNSYASKGLGSSGAAIKGATDYATGAAGTTYQQMFDNYWKQNRSIYDMLTGQSAQGIQAASGVTGANTGLTNSQMQSTIGAGNAEAAMWNGIGGAVSGATNNIAGYNFLSNFLKTNGTAPTQSMGPMYAGVGGNPYYGPVNPSVFMGPQ